MIIINHVLFCTIIIIIACTYQLASRLHSLPGNILGSTVSIVERIIELDGGAESSCEISVEVVHVAQRLKVSILYYNNTINVIIT